MVTKKSSKKTKKPVNRKGKQGLFLKKVKKYATPSNIYRSLLLAGTLGMIGTALYRKKVNAIVKAKTDETESINKIRATKKELEECYEQILKATKEYPERLEKYDKESKKEIMGYMEGVRQLSLTVNARKKRKQRGGEALVVSVPQEYDLSYYTQKLDKCKQARENQMKAFIQKVHNIEDKTKSIKRMANERKLKLMEILRQQ